MAYKEAVQYRTGVGMATINWLFSLAREENLQQGWRRFVSSYLPQMKSCFTGWEPA